MVADADILFAAYRDGVFRYLCRIVGYGEAGELTQQVFLRVSRGPVPSVDDSGHRAWIFSIARNLALNHVRDGKRRSVAVQLSETAGPFDRLRAEPPTQETAAVLRDALDRLPDLDRDVFLMREASGLSYDEIATACALSTAAVRSRLHRARVQLRQALGPALRSGQTLGGVRLYDRTGTGQRSS